MVYTFLWASYIGKTSYEFLILRKVFGFGNNFIWHITISTYTLKTNIFSRKSDICYTILPGNKRFPVFVQMTGTPMSAEVGTVVQNHVNKRCKSNFSIFDPDVINNFLVKSIPLINQFILESRN